MKVNLSKREVGTILMALLLASNSEEELIECHWNKYAKKYFDMKTVRACRGRIKRFENIIAKLRPTP